MFRVQVFNVLPQGDEELAPQHGGALLTWHKYYISVIFMRR